MSDGNDENPTSAAGSIAFTREELVVLAELDRRQLPLLGERPLGDASADVRAALVDSARRSLLARGIVTRTADGIDVSRAALGLLEIVEAGSVRIVLDEQHLDGSLVARHAWFAVPYASVEVWVDGDGNHRFLPFATVDLLLRVVQRAGLRDATSADAPPVELPFGAWTRARRAMARVEPDLARRELLDADLAPAAAEHLVDTMARTNRAYAVQVLHHPSRHVTSGGELAWLDASAGGVWTIPTIDQPFAHLDPRATRQQGLFAPTPGRPAIGAGPESDTAEAADTDGLDGVAITLEPTSPESLANRLASFLPAPG